ncbi:hypothetical protein C8R46DRAFT_310662 [Mycena filopes]|nr:hypothetical protein C8R46DRAFT_310662 [Mycena filopes]
MRNTLFFFSLRGHQRLRLGERTVVDMGSSTCDLQSATPSNSPNFFAARLRFNRPWIFAFSVFCCVAISSGAVMTCNSWGASDASKTRRYPLKRIMKLVRPVDLLVVDLYRKPPGKRPPESLKILEVARDRRIRETKQTFAWSVRACSTIYSANLGDGGDLATGDLA